VLSFWIDSNRLARSGVFLIWVRNSFNCGCLSENESGVQCYDHYITLVSNCLHTSKLAVFLQTNVLIYFLHNLSVFE
jgi:hypothetical protein